MVDNIDNTISFEDRKKAYKARLAKVTAREDVLSHLNVELPPHLHGEWERNDPAAIERKKQLGFVVDTEYATMNSIYGNKEKGSPTKIGDVVFMITDKANMAALDELRQEEYQKRHGKVNYKGQVFDEAETREFKDSGIDGLVTTIEEGNSEVVSGKDLADRIKT